jgi:cytidylate kinase
VKWNNYNVPIVNEGRVPLLERNTVVALRTERIRLDELPRLASGLQRLGRDVADLDGLLCLGNKAELRVMVTASDAYTHATTTRIACYRKDDIATGPFLDLPGRAGLEVESDNPPVADRPAGIAAVLLIGAPGSGKSSVLGALATRLEIAEVEHGAIESEELARGFPRANASTWIAQLQAALRFQRDSGRRLFLIAATTESDSELRGLIAASKSDLRLVVCLAATADVLAERLQRREPDGWPGKAALIARGREMAERIPALSGIDVRIDTSSGDAAEIAAQIHGEMQRRGLLTAPSEWSAA